MIAFVALVSAAALLLLSLKDLNLLSKTYFKVAIPTAFFYATANILQKIGLQYTTPTRYSFLENLSCVVVPLLLFLFIKKKPSFLTVLASLLCLVSTFILNGMAAGRWFCDWPRRGPLRACRYLLRCEYRRHRCLCQKAARTALSDDTDVCGSYHFLFSCNRFQSDHDRRRTARADQVFL